MTLIEKNLQVLRASFINSDWLLDQKELLKARNVAVVHGYERKEFHKLKGV
jgi:hypothetical protein